MREIFMRSSGVKGGWEGESIGETKVVCIRDERCGTLGRSYVDGENWE